MTIQRYGGFRTRSLSPRQRTRDRDRGREENGRLSGQSYCGSVRREPDMSKTGGSVERKRENEKKYDDGDAYSRNLSQFNETLQREESAFMKFRWDNLLPENPTNANTNAKDSLGNVSGAGSEISARRGFNQYDFSDMGVVRKSIPMEFERTTPYSSYPMDVTATRRCEKTNGGFVSPLGTLDVGVQKNCNFQPCNASHLEELSARKLFKEEMKPVNNASDASYARSISDSKPSATSSPEHLNDDLNGMYRGSLHISSEGMERRDEMPAQLIGHGGYGQSPPSKSFPTSEFRVKEWAIVHGEYGKSPPSKSMQTSEFRVKEVAEYTGTCHSPIGNVDATHAVPGVQRSGRSDTVMLPRDHVYTELASVQEDYRRQRYGRASVVDSILDKIHETNNFPSYGRDSVVDSLLDKIHETSNFPRDGAGENRILDHHHPLQEERPDIRGASPEQYLNVRRQPRLTEERDREYAQDLCYRSNRIKDGVKFYLDSDSQQLGESHDLERGGEICCSEEGLKTLPISQDDQDPYETECSLQQMQTTGRLGVQDSSENMLKRKRVLNLSKIIHNSRSKLFCSWNVSDEIHDLDYEDEQWTQEDIERLLPLEDSKFLCNGDFDSDNFLATSDLPGKHVKPVSRDIKMRLGPAQTDRKKRLRCIQKGHSTLPPWLKIDKQNKVQIRNSDNYDGSIGGQGDNSSKIRKKGAKKDYPEDSEEFKQLVHAAFLKFVKLLNGNSAQQRKYMEQGGTGTFKCGICGSKSKDFVGTLSLVQHAFMSRATGSRADHLGLHKALCVLLGWKVAPALNIPWFRQELPHSEAMTLREDLIIWPPVIVIHNSSIGNNNPDERLIVSIEGLRAILRDMGCSMGITNVCRGKAANQSIMVVSFHGTFSGLQEAERLHKLYAECKHGRAEFQQIKIGNCKSNMEETQYLPADRVRSVLYGYLGIAGDLDKLHFETKKRCVVKSKKEIKAIAEAILHTN